MKITGGDRIGKTLISSRCFWETLSYYEQCLKLLTKGRIHFPRSSQARRTIKARIIEEERWVKVTSPSRKQSRAKFTWMKRWKEGGSCLLSDSEFTLHVHVCTFFLGCNWLASKQKAGAWRCACNCLFSNHVSNLKAPHSSCRRNHGPFIIVNEISFLLCLRLRNFTIVFL